MRCHMLRILAFVGVFFAAHEDHVLQEVSHTLSMGRVVKAASIHHDGGIGNGIAMVIGGLDLVID